MPSASKKKSDILSPRALNRALLARQMLLRRRRMSVIDAVEHLVGLQAQAPTPPYFGLWTRLEEFRPEELSRAVADREVVRIALMRSTIHLVSARDCLRLRPTMQPVMDRALQGATGRKLDGLDLDAVVAVAREIMDERPQTFGEIGMLLRERWPDRDAAALAHVARALIPLVQLPPRGLWRRSGQAVHGPAEGWLGRELAPAVPVEDVVLRYLAAFGPATVNDIQTWCGLTRLRTVTERLRPRLRAFRDEQGRELFDLPDAPRPGAETPAPPRFLPEFDNVLLSYDDRTRVIDDRYRPLVFRGGIIDSTVLVDGFVGGTWRIERTRGSATLHVELFEQVTKATKAAIAEEGERLLAFAAAELDARDVRVVRRS